MEVEDAALEPSVEELDVPGHVLNPRLDVVVYSEDEVRVRQGTWSDWTLTLHDDERRGVLGRVFTGLLAGARTPDELQATVGIDGRVSADELESLLDDLRAAEVVVGGTGDTAAGAHARNGHGPARREAFDVTVVGDGPTCGLLASYLTEAGVTADAVALSGEEPPRATIAASPHTTDLLVVALESLSPTVLSAASSWALDRGLPWLGAYSDGPLLVVGPIYVPGETGCYAEFEAQLLSACTDRTALKAYRDALTTRRAPRRAARWQGGVAAGWLVGPVIDFLETGASDLVGRATVFDFASSRVEHVRCLTLPRCPACRGDRGGHNPWD